jgi:hypothetical protein
LLVKKIVNISHIICFICCQSTNIYDIQNRFFDHVAFVEGGAFKTLMDAPQNKTPVGVGGCWLCHNPFLTSVAPFKA